MADIIKIFYDYGKTFENDLVESFNQINEKKIDEILEVDIHDYNYRLYDKSVIENRLILYTISSAGGNLFPFVYISEKLFDDRINKKKGGLTKSFNNLLKYIKDKDKEKFEKILENFDSDKIKSIVEEIKIVPKRNYYIALSYKEKFFNEIFDYVFYEFIKSKEEVEFIGFCYIENKKLKIGFDPQLNFCSLNELNNSMSHSIKPRILSLSPQAGQLVKLGFEKIFTDFKFKLMNLDYILLPTVLSDSQEMKKEIFKLIKETRKISADSTAMEVRETLERELEYVVKNINKNKLENSVLLSFLFYRKSNKEIIVYHTIEDVSPSRISIISELLKERDVNISSLSKYLKKQYKESHPKNLYLRDYIDNRLLLAKLFFGTELLNNSFIIKSIYSKILHGNNSDNERRDLSLILNGYYKDDTNFTNHQRYIDFLSLSLKVCKHFKLGGNKMKFSSLEEMVEWKLDNVSLMNSNSAAKEFYLLGLLSALVISTQKTRNADSDFKSSLESYLNSIGIISSLNKNRVFNKIIDGAKKYNVYGVDWDYLLEIYSNTKSISEDDKVSTDIGNILFVMGSIDYKKLKKNIKQEKKHG